MSNLKQEKPDSYKTLAIYQKSECIYDVTYYFVNNFLSKSKDRTVDQMVQAARSCKQNIVEGYSDAEGSSESEHKLSVIAKGSLEENSLRWTVTFNNETFQRMVNFFQRQAGMKETILSCENVVMPVSGVFDYHSFCQRTIGLPSSNSMGNQM